MPGFGSGHRFSRRRSFHLGNAVGSTEVLYGPNYGPRGPRRFLVTVWNQRPVGYCYETENLTENLYAKWEARGVNTLKHQHPGFVIGQENAQAVLDACQAEGLMLIAAPRFGEGFADYRDLAVNDPYWRTHWIAYAFLDEPDLYPVAQSVHFLTMDANELDRVRKPGIVNFTSRISQPSTAVGAGGTVEDPVVWKEFFEAPQVEEITHDSYNWHLEGSDTNATSGAREAIGYFGTTWNMFGPHVEGLDASIQFLNRLARGRRFTASRVGLTVHMSRSGPIIADGGTVPQPLTYAPGDKAVGHYVATGRVDFLSGTFPRGGLHQPGRFLRNDFWTGVVHGSSNVLIFPQIGVGAPIVTGYVSAATQQLVITSTAPHGRNNISGALAIQRVSDDIYVGQIRRDNPQISGTANGAGTWALDPTKIATTTSGSVGSPVQFRLWAPEGPWADGTNAENAAELTIATANIRRMESHPTGGNLLIDPVQGGRRAFTALRCPDMSNDPRLYKEDMTQAPIQPGYNSGGEPMLDASNEGPGWDFGWPMGFEGFRVVGDDGATYIYVHSLSNGNRPTWFPGYAALGLPARPFGPFELAGFRRVGSGSAVEMTGTSAVLKAAVDDGPASWFWIETTAITQDEGSGGGTAAYAITVRRGGSTAGTNTVTATVSGTGSNPANAADFAGAAFPSQVLSFAPTETTKTFTVNVNRDATIEATETFAVTLSSPSTGTALVASGKDTITCTITNDDFDLMTPGLLASTAVISAYNWASPQTMIAGDGGTVVQGDNDTIATVPNAKSSGTFDLMQTTGGDRPIYNNGAIHDGTSDFMRVSFTANTGPANATLVYVVKTTDTAFMLAGTSSNAHFAGIGEDGQAISPDGNVGTVAYVVNGTVVSAATRDSLRDAVATGAAVTVRISGLDFQDPAISDIRNSYSNAGFPFFINGSCMLVAILNGSDSDYANGLTKAEQEATRQISVLGL